MSYLFDSNWKKNFIKELKTYVKWPLFIIVVVVIALLLRNYLSQHANKTSVSQRLKSRNHAANKLSAGIPVRLVIPAIYVNASVQLIGVGQSGEMEVPSNSVDVGWFKLGVSPGEKGSAVIAGHFDGKNGSGGVFANLHKVQNGDKLYIIDDNGASISFVVRKKLIYNPGYADDVFSLKDSAHLNLITCDGLWDGDKKSYTKRLVVFADIVQIK